MKTTDRAIRSVLTAISALILLATARRGRAADADDRRSRPGPGRGRGTVRPPHHPRRHRDRRHRRAPHAGRWTSSSRGTGSSTSSASASRSGPSTSRGVPDSRSRATPTPIVHEIDATRHVRPAGLRVDLHLHTGGVPKAPEAEYTYKLWMSHGITTGRGVAFGPHDVVDPREGAERGERDRGPPHVGLCPSPARAARGGAAASSTPRRTRGTGRGT